MKKISLRLRLLIFFSGVSCLIWLAAGLVSWYETKEKIDEFFDQYQLLLARQLASADWAALKPGAQKQTNRIISRVGNADEEDEAIGFAVFDRDGKMVFHDNENGRDFVFQPELGRFAEQKVDGEKWHTVWINSADKRFVIAVGQELEYRDEVALDMAEEFLWPWLGGLLFLLAAVIFFIGREFAPLRRMAAEIAVRNPDDLSPLDGRPLPAEVSPLIGAVNRLLQKVDHMLQNEKSFISDSAHELRSPLAALKVQLEVLQLAENDAGVRRSAIAKMEEGIERSARLVEQLLILSRLDSRRHENADEPIDWRRLAKQLQKEYKEAATQKQLRFNVEIASAAPIERGNPVLLSTLLRNLFDNAVKYSRNGSDISVIIDNGKIEVANMPATMDEAWLPRLGERFFRPPGQSESGSGLGLSIVGKIAALHGCTVEFSPVEDKFTVRVVRRSFLPK